MKSIISFLLTIFISIGYTQNKLPNIVDVHIDQFDQIQNFNDTVFDVSMLNPDTISQEITDCNYTLDFKNKRCMLFYEGQMIADVAILDVQPFENKIEVTLDDSAIETKIILDLDKNEFLYYYKLIFGYNITKPTKYTMVKF
jgi:hypothetical protein